VIFWWLLNNSAISWYQNTECCYWVWYFHYIILYLKQEKPRKCIQHKFLDECTVAPYLTIWRSVFLEKLIISILVKKFLDFPETWKFITMFTSILPLDRILIYHWTHLQQTSNSRARDSSNQHQFPYIIHTMIFFLHIHTYTWQIQYTLTPYAYYSFFSKYSLLDQQSIYHSNNVVSTPA
jgi:hypothetical protein